MIDSPLSQTTCYVFDTSSLIKLERMVGLNHLPGRPGKWLVVPTMVAKQLNSEGAPKETKNWLANGKFSTFNFNSEHELYMTIRVKEKFLEDPDIQGIVIAQHRKGTYVVEEGRAQRVAENLGVRTLNARQFMQEIMPRMQGF